MPRVSTFDPDDSLIVVDADVCGPDQWVRGLRLALDTAATLTTLTPPVAARLGYAQSQRGAWSVIRSAIGRERGYIVDVIAIRALDITLPDIRVQVATLPELEIDGLLGLSFLYQLNYEIRSKEGRILVERAA